MRAARLMSVGSVGYMYILRSRLLSRASCRHVSIAIMSRQSLGLLVAGTRAPFVLSILCFAFLLYTVSQKNKTVTSCPLLPQMLTDFQNSFTDRLSGKFATNSYLNIPTP